MIRGHLQGHEVKNQLYQIELCRVSINSIFHINDEFQCYFDHIIHQFYQYFTYFLYLYYIFDLFFMFILYILLLFLSCYYTPFTYYFRLCRANTHYFSYYFILFSYFYIFFHLFYQYFFSFL